MEKTYAAGYFTKTTMYTAEASDLGLRPGEWPKYINIGEEQFMYWDSYKDSEGDISHVLYVNQVNGNSVKIFND